MSGDPFDRWNLTPVINASGTMTSLGASRVHPETRALVDRILASFVDMDELQSRAGAVIARLTGAEAGCITACSAAAMTQAVAACLTGADLARIEALPATDGENRVILPMGHMVNYGAGWCPRHIEGTDHFLFYTLEKLTGKKFLHGQPVGLGVIVGSMLHEDGTDEMLDTIAGIGLDIRPEAMGLTWDQLKEGLRTMRPYVNEVGLWHSIAHDAPITEGFISDLRRKLDQAYAHK